VLTRFAFLYFLSTSPTFLAGRARLAGGLAFEGLVGSIGTFRAQLCARCGVGVYRAFLRGVGIVAARVTGRTFFALSGLTF